MRESVLNKLAQCCLISCPHECRTSCQGKTVKSSTKDCSYLSMAQKCQLWFQTRTVSSPREVLVVLAPQTKLQQHQLMEFLSNFQNVKPPRKAPIDDFLSTVLDPQFVSFLPRRIEDSATVIWVYLYTQCDLCLPKEKQCVKFRNDWSICSKRTKFSEKGFIIQFSRHWHKTKNASLRNPVERPSDCRVR